MNRRYFLFVCTGNTCRSPIAVALFLHMLKKEKIDGVEAFSRGVSVLAEGPMTNDAIQTLKDIGIRAPSHKSQKLKEEDVRQAERILVMTQAHLSTLLQHFPDATGKTRLLGEKDIADPIGGSPSDYEKCRIDIQNALLDLMTDLKSEGSSKT